MKTKFSLKHVNNIQKNVLLILIFLQVCIKNSNDYIHSNWNRIRGFLKIVKVRKVFLYDNGFVKKELKGLVIDNDLYEETIKHIRNKEAEQTEFDNIISTEENRTKEALNEIINSVKHGDEEEKDQLLEQKIEELSAKIDKLMAKLDG